MKTTKRFTIAKAKLSNTQEEAPKSQSNVLEYFSNPFLFLFFTPSSNPETRP